MKLLRTSLAWIASLAGLLVAVPVAIGLLPFMAVAGLTIRLSRIARRAVVDWPELFEFDPLMGWRSKPNLDCRVSDDAFRVTTDSDGWRSHSTRLAEADVVVFGDSFAFGFGVDDRHYFDRWTGNVRIKAVGTAGYSMVQPMLWMRRLQEELRGKVVVWLVYLGNDLDGNLHPFMSRYRAPFVRQNAGTGSWEVVTSHIRPEAWPFPSRRTSYENFVEICTDGFLAQRAFSACEFLIGQGRETCTAVGARLLVATVPDLAPVVTRQFDAIAARRGIAEAIDLDLPDRRLAEICRRLDVRFVPLATHLEESDYLKTDGHWSPRGHRRFGELIRSLHATERPSEQASPFRQPSLATAASR